MNILGISAFYHDSAAALIRDGRVLAAAQEERFTRIKHDAAFPSNAIQFCLKFAQMSLDEVDYIVFYEKPLLKFERLMETYLNFAPKGFSSFRLAMPLWLREKLFQKRVLKEELVALGASAKALEKKFLFAEHHQSHAASAFFCSPYEEAVVLTMDGVGEWSTTSVGIGRGSSLEIAKEIQFPHSLGLLYSAFTYYTGFKVNSGEYKLMGLAPYGEPKYKKLIFDHLVDLKPDGSFRLNMEYFDYCTGLRMTNNKFADLFGEPARTSEAPLTQKHMDIAASIQAALEEIVLKMTRNLHAEFGIDNLCLAGGVALNCVANGKILRDGKFKNIWIQPAAGDAGGAVGAALSAYYSHLGNRRIVESTKDSMHGSYLGPEFTPDEIESRLNRAGARYKKYSDDQLYDAVSEAMVMGKAVGWFQGRMEFGPRALGGRSIIADPRSSEMQTTLNLRVKFRESFRPFAPSVLKEDVDQWFDLSEDSPYMLMVANVKETHLKRMSADEEKLFGIDKLKVPRSTIPAVTHVDYSARIQTVHSDTNPRYHKLISRFKEKTGCPVVVNTSFNVRGEPIVCTPEDAFRCFMGTGIEALAVGNYFLTKEDQDPALLANYKDKFELD